jgi:four helix bundle protein
MNGYQHLTMWQRGFAVANEIYTVTAEFPKNQQFSLVQQMQRAAVSIPSNIAEGSNRQSAKEYRQFLCIALGSLGELETQIMIAQSQRYVSIEKAESLLSELNQIGKMLRGYIKKLKPVSKN